MISYFTIIYSLLDRVNMDLQGTKGPKDTKVQLVRQDLREKRVNLDLM